MPAIVREDGFVVRIHGPPREHPPPHVHVEHGPDELAVIRLGTPATPPAIWKIFKMKDADVVHAMRIVEKHHLLLIESWWRIHGNTNTD